MHHHVFSKKRIMLTGCKLSVCTELSKIVKNVEDSQAFPFEKKNRVSKKKKGL